MGGMMNKPWVIKKVHDMARGCKLGRKKLLK